MGLVITPVSCCTTWAPTVLVCGRWSPWSRASPGLLDPAFRSALIKHLAETDARGDRAGRDAVVTSALLFYVPLASLMLAGFLPLREPVLRLLRLPQALQAEAGDAFFIGLVGLALSWVLGIFPAIVDARQRMDLTNGLGVVCLVVTAALTVALVEKVRRPGGSRRSDGGHRGLPSGIGVPGVAGCRSTSAVVQVRMIAAGIR